jgi:CBS-domain-containing membrane protein
MRGRVRDVMTQDVVTVDEHAAFKEVAGLLTERRVSALPVLDADGRVVGVVSEADLMLKEEFPEGHRRAGGSRAGTGVRPEPRRPAPRRPS